MSAQGLNKAVFINTYLHKLFLSTTFNSCKSVYPTLINHRRFFKNIQNSEYLCSVYWISSYHHNLVLFFQSEYNNSEKYKQDLGVGKYIYTHKLKVSSFLKKNILPYDIRICECGIVFSIMSLCQAKQEADFTRA